jgi:hypothetical protein
MTSKIQPWDESMTVFNWRNFLTLVSVMILIGVEVFGVAFAAAWALAGMFELADLSRWGLMGVFGFAGLIAMRALWTLSVRVEPIRT